jgi:hypothetical protein
MRLNLTRSAAPKWHRVLQEGVLPAYDEALKILQRDSLELKDEVELFQKEVVQVERELDDLTAAGAEEAGHHHCSERDQLAQCQVVGQAEEWSVPFVFTMCFSLTRT